MADYKINAQINFKLNSANAKPIMDSLEKQFRSRPLNLPVNFKFKGVNTEQINQYNNSFKSLTHTITQLGNASLKSATALSSLSKQIRQTGSSLGSFGQASTNLNHFQAGTSKLANNIGSVGVQAGKAGKQVISFAESVGISTRRFASFGVAVGIIANTSLALRRATVDALEFDRQMVRLAQVGGDSDQVLSGIEKTISKLGRNLGVSSKDMVAAAVTIRQAGLSARDTSKALEVLGKTTLSPTFEDLKSTTEGLIAIFNQFDGNIMNMEKHFDAITRASANYAVESTDIVEAIKRTGGAFKEAGGNIEQLIAMFTTIRSTTRESAESIATGMRTIIARLEDPTIAQKLHAIGVELYDAGKFVGPAQAIERIGDAIRKLPSGDIRAFEVIKDIGGLRQPSRVIPLLYNSDITKRVMQDIGSSQGALAKDAEEAQKALLVQLSKVKESFLDLFRVIATDSSVKNTLSTIISLVNGLTEAMRHLKPLIPVFLAFATYKAIGYGKTHIQQFRRGVVAPITGYAEGGTVGGSLNLFQPRGSDTQPAMLTPGEFVLNKNAAKAIGYDRLNRWNQSIHFQRFAKVPSLYEGYESLADLLTQKHLEHQKRLYRVQGDYRFRKSGNWLQTYNKAHRSEIRQLVREHLGHGNPIDLAKLGLYTKSGSNTPTISYHSGGGLVGYFADGGEIPFSEGRKIKKVKDKNYIAKQEHGVVKLGKEAQRGNFSFGQSIPTGTGDYQVLPVGGIQTNVVPPWKASTNFQSPPGYSPPINPNEDPAFIAEQQRLADQYRQQNLREQVRFGGSMSRQGSTQAYLRNKSNQARNLLQPSTPYNFLPFQGVSRARINDISEMARGTEGRIRTSSARNFLTPGSSYSDLALRGSSAVALRAYRARKAGLIPEGPQSNPRDSFNLMPPGIGQQRPNNNIFTNEDLPSLPTFGVLPTRARGRFAGQRRNLRNIQLPVIQPGSGHFSEDRNRAYISHLEGIYPFADENRGRVKAGPINADRRDALAHFNGMMSSVGAMPIQRMFGTNKGIGQEDEMKKRYRYTAKGLSGQDVAGGTLLASSEKAARDILASQGKFITSIKKIDDTFSKRFFPTLSKWLTGTTQSVNGMNQKSGGILGKLSGLKKIGPAGLLAGSIAAPMIAEHVFGANSKAGSVVGGLTSGAAAGAGIGSTIGPVGTALGALAGAALGATSALKAFDDEAKETNFREFLNDIKNVQIDQNQNLTTSSRSTISTLLSKSIQEGGKEKYDTIANRMALSFGGKKRFNVSKYKALELIPEEQKNVLSDTIKGLAENISKQHPGKSYSEVIRQVGNFKVGNTNFGAGEILGLNKKNIEELQRNIAAQNKSHAMQEKMNALLAQLNKEMGLTAAQLEAFSTALQTSGEQYELRSQYTSVGSGALTGQISAAPANVGLNNLGGANTIAGQLYSFGATGGGYDQARQALLQIVQGASQAKLGNMTEEEAAIRTGTKAGAAFRGTGIGGQYNQQIAEHAEYVLGNTTKLQETVRDRGADKVVDQILEPFKNIKDTGSEAAKNFQAVYGKQQQAQADKYNRQFELRQQSAALTGSESAATNEAYLRLEALKPDATFITNNRSRFIGGPNRASTTARNRVVSQGEMIANGQLGLQIETFRRQQGEFGAAGLTAPDIAKKYRNEENKLGGLLAQRQQAVVGGAGINVIKGFDDQILKTQDDMRNYATALKNLADNTSILEATQKKYENAVGQFTADYESRKNDANTLAFGSRGEKMQLMQRENITQQALGLNAGQFAELPDQIKKIVFERLQETQGMTRSVEQYDKYGRFRGTKDITGEQAIQQFRQPYQDMLQTGASRRLRQNAQNANNLVEAATENRLGAQRELIGLGQQNANKQVIQGEDNFQKYLAGINQSIAQQMSATDKFLKGSAELVSALNGFKGEVKIERSGRLEVILNSGGAMEAIRKELNEFHSEIMEQVIEKIRSEIKNQPLR